MQPLLLSVLIPLYNEEAFIGEILRRVVAAPLPEGLDRELIVVDDGSSDGSPEIVEEFAAANRSVSIRLIRHARNQGKGAAIRTALRAATGHYSIIQDAAECRADCGDRFLVHQPAAKAGQRDRRDQPKTGGYQQISVVAVDEDFALPRAAGLQKHLQWPDRCLDPHAVEEAQHLFL